MQPLFCRTVYHFIVTNMELLVQIQLPRNARNLMDRLLCDVDDRLGSNGVQELKVQYTRAIYAFKWTAPMAHSRMLDP